MDEFGRVDTLISGASGWAGRASFSEMDMGKVTVMVVVDAQGMLPVTTVPFPQMLQQRGGTVLDIASIQAIPGREEIAAYAPLKNAPSSSNRCPRAEVHSSRFRVARICPGRVATDGRLLRDLEPREMLCRVSPHRFPQG